MSINTTDGTSARNMENTAPLFRRVMWQQRQDDRRKAFRHFIKDPNDLVEALCLNGEGIQRLDDEREFDHEIHLLFHGEEMGISRDAEN